MADQQRAIRNTIICIIVFMALVICGFIWRMSQPVIMSKQELQVNGAVLLNTPRIFSDFELRDHRDQPFTAEQLRGQWSILFFAFSHCPDICPTTLSTLNDMYSKLSVNEQAKLQIVMVSLDAERDSVEKLADYMPYFNADFIGVTGNQHFVRRMAGELNIAYNRVPLEGDNYTIDHSTQLLLINPKGDYHAFFKAPHSEIMLRQTWRSIDAIFD
ncbi:MAG: SCO family protein [Cellvibrionales bacterium]|nr:SCO family protein [Porticoccaceae bacterium]|tara:strand:- start:14439 stop:15083 length:645 start_codon:yes stop_codon:yes gene_type:complete